MVDTHNDNLQLANCTATHGHLKLNQWHDYSSIDKSKTNNWLPGPPGDDKWQWQHLTCSRGSVQCRYDMSMSVSQGSHVLIKLNLRHSIPNSSEDFSQCKSMSMLLFLYMSMSVSHDYGISWNIQNWKYQSKAKNISSQADLWEVMKPTWMTMWLPHKFHFLLTCFQFACQLDLLLAGSWISIPQASKLKLGNWTWIELADSATKMSMGLEAKI